MDQMLNYLFEASVCMLLLYLPYLMVRSNTFFNMNRFYLLFALIVSIVIPVFNFAIMVPADQGIMQIILDPVTITNEKITGEAKSILSFKQIVFIGYLTGIFVCLVLFIIRIYQIIHLIKNSTVVNNNGIYTVIVGSDLSPSSFFNYIFLPDDQEMDEIFAHEKVHVKYKHSWDIIFIELVSIVFWFNPVRYGYKNSLKNVHEFQADREILLNGVGAQRYQQLLVEKTFGYSINQLAIRFNYSPLKKRLIMMTKNKTQKRNSWKYLLIIPVIAVTFIYFGCETGNDKVDDENQNLENIEAFDVVDVMPEYPGGIDEIRTFVAENLGYPMEVRERGIEGKIYVKFIVNANGEIVKPRIVRSDIRKIEKIKVENNLDQIVVVAYEPEKSEQSEKDKYIALLEEEALRVVGNIPDFEKPGYKNGKKVSVFYTIPINFVLQ